ncbi:MAG TPA: hypothetical protein VGJ33_03835 [Candidatus Angelobacter sp.]|jgi:ubiquinone biosynthesis protein UbiJ
MKAALSGVIILVIFAASGVAAQTQAQPSPAQQGQAASPVADLNAILLQVQQATSTASVNIGKLRIEKWKTDSEQRQQLQEIAESLQKNIANAMPGMVSDVQTSRGGVAASFKLYHNLNVVYENLSYLADVAGSLGKKDEFEPLAADAAALESARKNLSTYIEQAALRLESAVRAANGSNAVQARQGSATVVPGKKVIVIDDADTPPRKRAKSTKKKSSATPTPTPAQAAASPH